MNTKLALGMIVNGVDSEADVLGRCLGYVSKEVDDVFITVTYKSGVPISQKILDICKLFNVHTSEYEWTYDFAAARNFNFSQVPKDFTHIFWLDADDAPRGTENLKTTIEAHPEADVFSMFYLYAFDEHKNPIVVHQKTRVIKNDGCVEWYGMGLHEDFKENRSLIRYAISDMDILHLTDDERLKDSRYRNYEIAKAWITKHPEDPRVYWNLGNSAFGIGNYDEALEAFIKFQDMSRSDEEKYIIRQRMSESYYAKGQIQKALDEGRYAIGLKPEYPDAYHLCGRIFYEMGRYEDAKNMFLNGLGRPAAKYKIIVYNPRDYDYTPLMWLSKSYYALNLPQLALPALEAAVTIVPADEALRKTIEILKKEAKEGDEVVELISKIRKIKSKTKMLAALNDVPVKFKFHPGVINLRNINFPKTESSGKDLVLFCGFTNEEWTPETIAQKGSGGSEEAAITMAAGLAERGWNVTVYNNCGTEESTHNGVTYKPYMSWNYRDKQDVVILWRQTKPLDWDINAPKIYVDMHDVIPAGEFTEDRIKKLTKVFFKSNYHRELYPAIPDYKTVVIPNGIWTERYSHVVEKDPNLIINTASPVRSLSALIDVMKMVRLEVPDAKMQWAYGWTVTDSGMAGEPTYPEWKNSVLKGMEEAGIEDLGRLTHEQVADLYLKAAIYAYPTAFREIDCISITKALAAGAFPISTDYGAIREKAGHGGIFVHQSEVPEYSGQIDFATTDEHTKKKIAEEIIHKLKNPIDPYFIRRWALDNFSWTSIIDKWQNILCE